MSKTLFLRCAGLPCATVVAALLAAATWGAEPGSEAAGLKYFAHPDGTNYFALSVKPPAATAAAGPHDVVIVVSTSASQIDEYRTKSLEALQSVLAGLGAEDRVRLIAADLDAVPLTKGFVAPNSAEMTAAIAALQQRTPLGSNDMEKALTTAAASFGASAKNPRALIYIGEGSSRANVISPEKYEKLVTSLAEQRIPVIGYGVGPRVDQQMLGSLAQQTGGTVIDDGKNVTAADAGRQLATAANAAVSWPSVAKWPAEMGEVFPKAMPPLRSDRDTVLIGTLKGKGPMQIDATVDGPGGVRKVSWNVTPEKANEDYNYLTSLVGQARMDGGLSLPHWPRDQLPIKRRPSKIF